MKLNTKDKYSFKFAGQILTGKFVSEDELTDGTKVYKFNYNNCIYPIREENIVKPRKKQK
jgi:hypothetical protein